MASILKFKHKRPKGRAQRRWVSRIRRHARVVKKIHGTSERPRLVVRRTLRHMEAQLVDDSKGECLTGVSTRSKEVQGRLGEENHKTAQSEVAGLVLAERAKSKGIESVVFDRGGYRYHGRVKAFAEGAREGGLKF